MFFLDDKIAGSELDGLVVAVDEVRGAGEFDSGVMMTSCDGDFLGKKSSMRCDNSSTDDVIIFISD